MPDESNPYATPQAGLDSEPAERIPTSHSPYGPLRDTRVLGRWVQGLLWLQSVFALVLAGINLYAGLQFSQEVNVYFDEVTMTQSSFYTLFWAGIGAFAVAFVATIVVFCVWTNKSMKNAWALRENSFLPSMTPGWAVGFYFIPIAMWWKPFQGMKQIWQVTFREHLDLTILRWWWGFWLIGNFADNISGRLPVETFEQLAFGSYYDAATMIPNLVGAILLVRIVGKVTQKQSEFYRQSF